MDKRGEFSAVAKLILLLVFAVLVLFAIGRFVLFILSQSAENACAQSIVKSGLDGVPNFDCKAERMDITRAELERGRELDAAALDDAVKREVANELYACWKTTGKGMVNPYKKSFEGSASATLASETFMITDIYLICKIASFRDIPDFNGLLFWMAMNKPQVGDEPYFDTVFNRKPTADEIDEFEKMEDSYDTDLEYAIVWRYINDYNHVVIVPYRKLVMPIRFHIWDVTDNLWLISAVGMRGLAYSPILMN
jgi:hypothetical protein